MTRPPRPRDRPLLTREILLRVTAAGSASVVAVLAIVLLHEGPFEHARWVAFTALVVGQVARAYANRSLTIPLHRLPPNPLLAAVGLLVVVIQLAIPYVPPVAAAFRASPLTGPEWAVVGVVALVPALVAEGVRTFRPGRIWVA